MIRTRFDPTALQDPGQQQWWNTWLKRANTATDKAIDAFETWLAGKRDQPFKFEFNSAIWKDLKDWLMEHVFYERCAYCERLISGYYGDAEHYRPKGAVLRKDEAGDLVCPDCDVTSPVNGELLTLGHPGYFWLAYDWRNLLPSCVFCNSGAGKNERFDIAQRYIVLARLDAMAVASMSAAVRPRESRRWPGHYYLSPADLDVQESPLLLNPLNSDDQRNPHRHIRFGVRGIVAAVDNSPLALHTIEVFRLNEEKLRQARQKAQAEFQDKFYDRMRRFDPVTGASEARQLLNEFAEGRYPFAAAVLDYYESILAKQPEPPRR